MECHGELKLSQDATRKGDKMQLGSRPQTCWPAGNMRLDTTHIARNVPGKNMDVRGWGGTTLPFSASCLHVNERQGCNVGLDFGPY